MNGSRSVARSAGACICAIVAIVSSGCGDDDAGPEPTPGTTVGSTAAPQVAALDRRLDDLADAVDGWAGVSTVDDGHAAAERAANLIVGPFGPGYGDRDGDGTIGGSAKAGLLPGLEGRPRGVALAARGAGGRACMTDGVLGGNWSNPSLRWQRLATAIDGWTATNDTLAELRSVPQRVVGLATLTLGSDDLEVVRQHGIAAAGQVDVLRAASDACR